MLGGYQTIDFKGATLNEETIIKGAFKKAKTGKALLIENLAGITGFTFDGAPTETTYAQLPIIVLISDVPTPVSIEITDEDVCSIVVPE